MPGNFQICYNKNYLMISEQQDKHCAANNPGLQIASNKPYFTQLAVISQLLYQTIVRQYINYGDIRVSQIQLNQQNDVCTLGLAANISKKMQQPTQQNKMLTYDIRAHITIIQIQTSIKFHISYTQNEYESSEQPALSQQLPTSQLNNKEIQEQKQKKLIQQGLSIEKSMEYKLRMSYQYIDEFWINYKNYLPKKIFQNYHMSDLFSKAQQQKTNKLIFIFVERIGRQFLSQINFVLSKGVLGLGGGSNSVSSGSNADKDAKENRRELFINAFSQNFQKIHRFLSVKEYKNLQLCSRELYKVLHTQKCYKIIFEQKWGRTGFDLQEKNWVNMYKKKAIQIKPKSIKIYSRMFGI